MRIYYGVLQESSLLDTDLHRLTGFYIYHEVYEELLRTINFNSQ
jgi:hypothetical protein